ncbi:MAG: tetratricopeptide repeat protein [Buchnera aphidicola (Nurudea yanoniella)]
MNIDYTFNKVQKNSILIFLIFFVFLFFYFFKFHLNINFDKQEYEKIIQESNFNKKNSIKNVIKFIENNHNNVYSTLASLYLSNMYAKNNFLYYAIVILQKNKKYIFDENILNIVTLNIAKMQLHLNDKNSALKTLDGITCITWNSIKHDIKGDIFISRNNVKKAISEWEKSIYYQNKEELKEIIKIKLKNFEQKYN